jgi:hypothetical protein
MTLAELFAQRRAAIAAFEEDLYGPGVHDISALNDASAPPLPPRSMLLLHWI